MTHENVSHKNKLEQADIGKLMTELCLQTTFSIMIYNFYTLTDTFFVASKIGSVASGAIGIFSPCLFIIGGISSTLGSGGASVISRSIGQKDVSCCKCVIGCVMWIWIVISIVITGMGLCFTKELLNLLGCTAKLYPYASVYGKIMLVSTIASTGFSGIMRAGGDSTYSTFQWICPVLINLILDPLFIYCFKWGIAGAALATLCAQLISLCSSVYYFFSGKVLYTALP